VARAPRDRPPPRGPAKTVYDLAAAALGAVDAEARAAGVWVGADLPDGLPRLAGELAEDRRYLAIALQLAIPKAAAKHAEIELTARRRARWMRFGVWLHEPGKRAPTHLHELFIPIVQSDWL
jgi:hypothetical protein